LRRAGFALNSTRQRDIFGMDLSVSLSDFGRVAHRNEEMNFTMPSEDARRSDRSGPFDLLRRAKTGRAESTALIPGDANPAHCPRPPSF
jgi:hypothetical protein